MSNYGVKTNGFIRKRLAEQLNEIREELKQGLGQEIELSPDTVLGVLSTIAAERHANIWELCEDVYRSMYPVSATGTNLDRAVSFTGVKRLSALPSSCYVVWYGEEGTVIPDFSCVKNKNTQVKYYLNGDLIVSKNNAYHVVISPAKAMISAGETLSITLNGRTYRYTANRNSIKEAMEKLNAELSQVDFIHSTLNDLDISIVSNGVIGFSVSTNDLLNISKLGVVGRVQTDGSSTDLAEEGDISEMIDLVNGVDQVNNLTNGSAGRNQESDSELYARYHKGVYRTGAGTAQSIRANLLELEGVTHAIVYENNSNSEQNNMPPHSLYAVVKGGLDNDIAEIIQTYRPAGITLHGDKSIVVRDSQNIHHTIKFSRPQKVYVWVNVVVNTFTDQNEYARTGYLTDVVENIMGYAESLNVGDDVILQRVIGKCVQVEGVGKVTVSLGKTSLLNSAEPVFSEDNIVIQQDQEAVFDRSIIRIS